MSYYNIPSLIETGSVVSPVYTCPLLTWRKPNIVLEALFVSAEF